MPSKPRKIVCYDCGKVTVAESSDACYWCGKINTEEL